MEARLGDRSLFPDLTPRAYLNHAGISPPSTPVRRAVGEVLAAYAEQGAAAAPGQHARRSRLREKIARLVGARPTEIAIVGSTTAGVHAIALCLPWLRGDRVVLFEGEFPANVTPWQRAAELFGLEVAFVPLAPFARADEAGLEALGRELQRGARLVAVSAVQFQTGLRMPLARIASLCAAAGAQLFVDGVQAVGAVPLDVAALGIDYLACGAHKWLMGLEGAGFLYVREGRADALRPHLAGWLSHEDPIEFLAGHAGRLRYDRPIRRRADLFESSSSAIVCQAALEASVDLLLALGPERIWAHVNGWIDRLEPELGALGLESLRSHEPARRSCILSLRPPPGTDLARLRGALAARGVSAAVPDGLLRLAPHWPNHLDEVPEVVAALAGALRSG